MILLVVLIFTMKSSEKIEALSFLPHIVESNKRYFCHFFPQSRNLKNKIARGCHQTERASGFLKREEWLDSDSMM